MRAHARQRWLGVGIVAGLATSNPARAEALAATVVASETSSGGVEVKVASSVPEGELTRGWIEERAAKVLAGLEPLEQGALVRVVVSGAPFDYRITVLLLREGTALDPEHQPARIDCTCGSDEMLDQVAGAIEAGARTIADVAQRQRAEARAEEEQRRKQRERAALALQQAPYRPTTLGRAGIGVLAAGGVTTLSGIIMAAQRDRVLEEHDNLARSWTTPGYAVLSIGLAVMVGGATALIVDAVRCRRAKARCVRPRGHVAGVASWSMRGGGRGQ